MTAVMNIGLSSFLNAQKHLVQPSFIFCMLVQFKWNVSQCSSTANCFLEDIHNRWSIIYTPTVLYVQIHVHICVGMFYMYMVIQMYVPFFQR